MLDVGRILVVDDRSVNRELLVTLLHHAGHETVEAADGVEALEAALRDRPDAMIVDLAMPRLDGLSFARAVRALPELAGVPILFYTGTSGEHAEGFASSIPNASVLTKPSEPEVILRRLDEALGRPAVRERPIELDPLNFRLSALVEIGIELAAASSSRRLVETFSGPAARLLGADLVGTVIRSDEARRFVAGRGTAGSWETLRDTRPIELLALEDRKAHAIGRTDPRMAFLDAPGELSSAIVMRVETRRAAYGLLWFGKRCGEFSSRDLHFASTLAAQFALAYENVSVQESQAVHIERSNRMLEAVFDLAPVAIVVVSAEGIVRIWNRAAERMFGWTAGEVIGREPPLLAPEMLAEASKVHARVLEGETIASLETKRLRRGGSAVDVSISAAVLRNPSSGLPGVMLIFSDISRLKTVEAELTQRAGDLEALSARLVAAQEEERSRVSREIHDELGQLLTATMFEISSMTSEQGGERVPRALELLGRTIESVRRIAADLRPAVLDEFGLVAAVENEVALFQQRTGIECDLSIRPFTLVLDPERSTEVFRIIQEAMTNVARHSQATRVEIRLRQSRSETLLEIRDNGIGIDSAAVQSGRSLGLIGIRERARRTGGAVGIEGVAGRGTIFTVHIPMSRSA